MIDANRFIIDRKVPEDVRRVKPAFWKNPDREVIYGGAGPQFTLKDIEDADSRLRRFAPVLMHYFSDTVHTKGVIESPLHRMENLERYLRQARGMTGNFFLKLDSHLPVAGSVKARGGIYEVLLHAENLAKENGMLDEDDDYMILTGEEARELFGNHTIEVGSTGNLGLSIGITAAALGFRVRVHMSSDAREWKKAMLRDKGAEVVEYHGDFSFAVSEGRKKSLEDPNSYFVDDENSRALFLGYSVAALRLSKQLERRGMAVNKDTPAFFYLPCGVGGAPGGISFGLRTVFGDHAHIFLVEPTHAPSMLVGMATNLHNGISVQDVGIDGVTEADGLAVGRPSALAGRVMSPIISGILTSHDSDMYSYIRLLDRLEGIKVEPSAGACLEGLMRLNQYIGLKEYLRDMGIDRMDRVNHFCWATGGGLVPESIMRDYLS